METCEDWHDLYLKQDVFGLVDVVENFRNTCIDEHHIDPLYSIGLPGFAFDAMLRHTRTELELLTDPDMYLMMEKGLIGGYTAVHEKYAEANNKHLPNHDRSKPTSFIVDWDAVGLYGSMMLLRTPIRNFQWVEAKKLADFVKYQKVDIACTVEVDVHAPSTSTRNLPNSPPCKKKWRSEERLSWLARFLIRQNMSSTIHP